MTQDLVLTARIEPVNASLDFPRKGRGKQSLSKWNEKLRVGYMPENQGAINWHFSDSRINQKVYLDGVWEFLSQQCVQRWEEMKARTTVQHCTEGGVNNPVRMHLYPVEAKMKGVRDLAPFARQKFEWNYYRCRERMP